MTKPNFRVIPPAMMAAANMPFKAFSCGQILGFAFGPSRRSERPEQCYRAASIRSRSTLAKAWRYEFESLISCLASFVALLASSLAWASGRHP